MFTTQAPVGAGQSVGSMHSGIEPLLELDDDDDEEEEEVDPEPPPPGIWLRSTPEMISHPVVDMNVSIAIPIHDAFVRLIERTLMTLPFRK